MRAMNCTTDVPRPNIPSQRSIFIALNLFIATFAVVGNILILIAVAKTPRLHTLSNYFICSLALADLIVGALIAPLHIIRFSIASLSTVFEVLCLQTLMITTMNLSAVSIDRYIAITKPLHYVSILTPNVTCKAIIIIWVSSTLLSLPSIFTKGEQRMIFWLITVLITLIVPLGIIFYCYEKIRKISKIHQASDCNRPTSDTMLRHIKNRKASVTFAIIIAVFLISFAPNLILNIVYAVGYTPCGKLPEYLMWSNSVTFLSSALNPLIYGARSRDYRRAFKAVIFKVVP